MINVVGSIWIKALHNNTNLYCNPLPCLRNDYSEALLVVTIKYYVIFSTEICSFIWTQLMTPFGDNLPKIQNYFNSVLQSTYGPYLLNLPAIEMSLLLTNKSSFTFS